MITPINIAEKFAKFSDYWSPKIVGQMNDFDIRAVKMSGSFIWHKHVETDELFMLVEGSLRIELRDGSVSLNSGDIYVVPKGVEHRPVAESECHALIISPTETINTGDVGGEMTAQDEWI